MSAVRSAVRIDARGALDDGDHAARFEAVALPDPPCDIDRGINLPEHLAGTWGPGEDTGASGHDWSRRPAVGRHEGGAEVAERRQVLGEGASDGILDIGGSGID